MTEKKWYGLPKAPAVLNQRSSVKFIPETYTRHAAISQRYYVLFHISGHDARSLVNHNLVNTLLEMHVYPRFKITDSVESGINTANDNLYTNCQAYRYLPESGCALVLATEMGAVMTETVAVAWMNVAVVTAAVAAAAVVVAAAAATSDVARQLV